MKNVEKIIKIMSYLSPASFASHVSGGSWLFPKHLKLINREITKTIKKGNGRLILNMPPRHGKSEFISKYLPAWYLINNPDKRVILTTYETSFATHWGRYVRNIISDYGKIFGIELDSSSKSVSDFHIEGHNGSMVCVGAGGSITGRGADLIIIDDPHKNAAEANSTVIRNNIWEWFRSTVYTRLEPNGNIIIIMTRWHEDDLCGRIMNSDDSENWNIIELKAIAEEGDILKRKPGQALWNSRYSKRKLNEIKNSIGNYWFSALYQQSPSISEGSIFQRNNFKYFSISDDKYILHSEPQKVFLKNRLPVFCTVDLAATVSEMSDYTVIITYSVTSDNQILILDIIREKFETNKHFSIILNHFHKWQPILIGIESVQYQMSLVKSLSERGIPVKPLKASSDKVSRALGIAAKMELGEVFFLNNADWLYKFERELIEFPKSKHDDQVDAFSYILQINSASNNQIPKYLKRKSIFR
jgi:predicted phage terminase large subunit-like protein